MSNDNGSHGMDNVDTSIDLDKDHRFDANMVILTSNIAHTCDQHVHRLVTVWMYIRINLYNYSEPAMENTH